MKMTKFFALALAAFAIASCSKEKVGDDNGAEINTPTYTTFRFNIGGGTRAAADFDPTAKPENDAADAKIGKLQLLIFNSASQALEYNGTVDPGSTSKTVLLTAGKKKIFIIANSDKLTDYNTAIDPTTFIPGDAGSTLGAFNALHFSAGTPQQLDIDKTGKRTFDLANLFSLSNTTAGSEGGLPMSNTNELTYTLNAGISESDAQGGAVSSNGVSETNTFSIQLYYMIAKARLVLAPGVLSAGDANKATIKDVKYSIRNLARATNYVQNVPTLNSPQSYYFSAKFENAAAYNTEFDNASNVSVPVTETAGDYLYVPENNSAQLSRGQSSYFSIKATFEPIVISKVEYDINTKVKYTYAKLAVADAGLNYIFTTKDVQGIPAGTYFTNVKLFQEAAWMMLNVVPFDESKRAEAEALVVNPTSINPTVGGDYMSYTGGDSYYRVDIGNGVGAETVYSVLRSNKYNATVNKITGPGSPSESDLAADPDNQVSAKTYIHATIIPAQWSPINQSADL